MIYLDNHATTRTDPAVVAAMLPLLETDYANPGSITHESGRRVAGLVSEAIREIASHFQAHDDEMIMTSGATESNNLALFGVALHPKQKRRRIVTLVTEHRALLDPLARLEKVGFEIVRLPVLPNTHPASGQIDLDLLANTIDANTALVSVMLANNEIGTLQPVSQISALCKRFGAVFHTDASQAVAHMPIDVNALGVDLMSFSAHKFYGPKGVGGLYVRQSPDSVRLYPQILGGGQQFHLRSGTLNSPGIVGMAAALRLLHERRASEVENASRLRSLLWQLLTDCIDGLVLNGPHWNDDTSTKNIRLPNNLNVCFPKVEGQSLMLELPELAVSSGSACTSAEPLPSHVLLGIGLSEDQARASLRFGIGRFNTEDEIRQTAQWLGHVHAKLASFAA